MKIGEMVTAVLLLLLALYGCAGLIRRVCLWFTRCPKCVFCCRLAIPRRHASLIPMVRCLQSQTVWEDPLGCRHTLLLLPDEMQNAEEELDRVFREAPMVLPITADQLQTMLQILAQEE